MRMPHERVVNWFWLFTELKCHGWDSVISYRLYSVRSEHCNAILCAASVSQAARCCPRVSLGRGWMGHRPSRQSAGDSEKPLRATPRSWSRTAS